MHKRIILIIVLTTCFCCGGCNMLQFPAYVLFGQTEKKVKAEYTRLKNTKAAIFVVSRPAFDFDYPYGAMNLALSSAHAISEHVKNVEFIDQENVQKYQFENLDWYSQPISQIGKRFGVQRLIYIDLYEYTLYEKNSINLLRGRIGGEVRIYEIDSATPNTDVYSTDIHIVEPEHTPVALSDEAMRTIQQQSTLAFAEELARKFYDHKKSIN